MQTSLRFGGAAGRSPPSGTSPRGIRSHVRTRHLLALGVADEAVDAHQALKHDAGLHLSGAFG